jgi:hypothetical protein
MELVLGLEKVTNEKLLSLHQVQNVTFNHVSSMHLVAWKMSQVMTCAISPDRDLVMLFERNHHILIAACVSRSWPADFKSSKQFVFFLSRLQQITMTLRCLTSLKLNSLLTRYFRVSKDFYKEFVATKSACHLEFRTCYWRIVGTDAWNFCSCLDKLHHFLVHIATWILPSIGVYIHSLQTSQIQFRF